MTTTDVAQTDVDEVEQPVQADAVARAALVNFLATTGMQQQELAERLGVHRTTVGSWLKGESMEHPQMVILALQYIERVAMCAPGEYATARRIMPYGETAREASVHGEPVPEKLREALGYLRDMGALLDRLEGNSLQGTEIPQVGIQGLARTVCSLSAENYGRLRTLFGDELMSPTSDASSFAQFNIGPHA